NIRELSNLIERALLLTDDGEMILAEHLFDRAPVVGMTGSNGTGRKYYEAIERATRAVIVESLEQNGGNRTRTAKDLGISARWLITNIRRYKIDAADTDDDTNDDDG